MPTADVDLTRARKGALISLVVLVGTFAALVQRYVLGVYWEKKWPLNTFLWYPHDRFKDLREIYAGVIQFETREITSLVYTPFTHVAMRIVQLFPYRVLFASLLVGFIVLLGAVLWRGITDRSGSPLVRLQTVIVLVALSYPALFAMDRANVEIVVWALIGAFLYFYYVKPKHWAWVPLALAIAMKIYPAVFLAILFADRKWRELVGAVLLAGLLEVSGALVLSTMTGYSVTEIVGLAIHTVRSGHLASRGLSVQTIPHGHTIWGVIMSWLAVTGRWSLVRPFGIYYTAAAVVAGLAIVFFIMMRETVPWKRVALLTIAMVALPVVSFDYTLIHMYLPLLLFANERRSDGLDRWYCWLFALLLVPLDLFFFGQKVYLGPFGASVLLYPAVLVTMLVTIVIRRFQLDHGRKVAALASGDAVASAGSCTPKPRG